MTTPKPIEGVILHPSETPGSIVELKPDAKALDLFLNPDVMPAIIAEIEARAKDFVVDLTTDKGRKLIASQAYKVAQTKTFLDEIGKAEVAKLKDIPTKIDAARKAMRERLDAIKDAVRKPLDQYEARISLLKARLSDIQLIPGRVFNSSSLEIQKAIDTLSEMATGAEEWGEFAAEAMSIKTLTLATLADALEKRQKWEADQAELERLRKAEAERKAEEEKERLRKEGEARALAALQAKESPANGQTLVDGMMTPEKMQTTPAEQVEPSLFVMTGRTPGEPTRADAIASVEHRRAYNREALADLTEALAVGFNSIKEAELVAEQALRAIVSGKIRHLSINY